MVELPFERVEHFVRIRVHLPDGSTARFLVDTGIGITILSPSVVERCQLAMTGSDYTGHRMSGQAVSVPLVQLPSLELRSDSPSAGSGGFAVLSGTVGVADFGPSEGAHGFDGILGLDLLGPLRLTVDPFTSVIALARMQHGGPDQIEIPVRLHEDGPAIDLRTNLRLPDGTVTEVEIDTGSAATILDERFMVSCEVTDAEPTSRVTEGVDETGHHYRRQFIPIPGSVSLAAAPATELRQPTVMFQQLALNGLIGTDFLDRYVQTYDTTRGILTLAMPDHT
ncbi:retropepsin-like aspartic protease [Flexivirga caeni]|uniref:Peptidase A2 domain-containing protein n=1 Tax=Flexivirga caeni TaxID=2294115 RepID=A0A3M9MG85_9MICO|nr:retropepsin-like aspartic protease [Flexivirga caeni]RNI23903.1 hypothetical protein EFY87_06455 [Flexivirga caeni]